MPMNLCNCWMFLAIRNTKVSTAIPNEKAIFLSDFINRGPKIRQVLEIVRPMVEEGTAQAVMGNHEFNIVAYFTEDSEKPGEFLRQHNSETEKQLWQTVNQLKPDELRSYLDWFLTLPMWLDLDGLRVVHACWDAKAITNVANSLEDTRRHHPGIFAFCLQEGKRPVRFG